MESARSACVAVTSSRPRASWDRQARSSSRLVAENTVSSVLHRTR